MPTDATSFGSPDSNILLFIEIIKFLGIPAAIGLFVHHFCIPSLIKWRKIREEIITATIQYGNFYVFYIEKDGRRQLSDQKKHDRLYQKLRRLAGEVVALGDAPFYRKWVSIRCLPDQDLIEKIRGSLIGWGNTLINMHDGELNRDVFIEALKMYLRQPNSYKDIKELQRLEWENARNR